MLTENPRLEKNSREWILRIASDDGEVYQHANTFTMSLKRPDEDDEEVQIKWEYREVSLD